MPICSLECPEQIECCTSAAARATSAAPTFFPIQWIDNRGFADGGMEYNNPSEAIFNHYCKAAIVAGCYSNADATTNATNDTATDAVPLAHQCDLDFQTVRIINLGTGTKPATLPAPKREILANLVLPALRMGNWLKQTLTEAAVNSERVASSMRNLAFVSNFNPTVHIEYRRFSADNGVCFIKMDKYEAIGEIRSLTEKYLGEDRIIKQLEQVAKEIAEGFIKQQDLPN